MANLDKLQIPGDNTEYNLMDGTLWSGHRADWEALTAEEKLKYRYVMFDDDEGSDTPWKVIASSTEGLTYREQLQEIGNAYSLLSANERKRSGILDGGFLLRLSTDPSKLSVFSCISCDSSGIAIRTARFYNQTTHRIYISYTNISTGAVTNTDISTTTNEGALNLVLFN